MTPLAHQLAKQLVLPVKQRKEFWSLNNGLLRGCLDDSHFFECTGALPFLSEIGGLLKRVGPSGEAALIADFAFLPAPKTWIEWSHPVSGGRLAIFLEEDTPGRALTHCLFEGGAAFLGTISTTSNDYYIEGGNLVLPTILIEYMKRWSGVGVVGGLLSMAHTFLLLINTPRIIGRRQHMPHAGLEKQLSRAFGPGKFPLRGWTEIKLEINKPVEIDDGEPHEAHLTGRRALHFCRKHIRIRQGRLEYVSAHWRGDPALGIKQSRYTLTQASP